MGSQRVGHNWATNTHTKPTLFFCSFSAYLILASFGTGDVVSWPFFRIYNCIQNCSVRGRGYYFTCQNVAYYYIDVIIDFQYCPGIWKSLVRGQILLWVHLTNNESINHWWLFGLCPLLYFAWIFGPFVSRWHIKSDFLFLYASVGW